MAMGGIGHRCVRIESDPVIADLEDRRILVVTQREVTWPARACLMVLSRHSWATR